jgi:hypothetical protein
VSKTENNAHRAVPISTDDVRQSVAGEIAGCDRLNDGGIVLDQERIRKRRRRGDVHRGLALRGCSGSKRLTLLTDHNGRDHRAC